MSDGEREVLEELFGSEAWQQVARPRLGQRLQELLELIAARPYTDVSQVRGDQAQAAMLRTLMESPMALFFDTEDPVPAPRRRGR
ncbi:MAG TPA: hypothetical protein VFU47_08295 [Armatimonadota bacterium]|nr:hypothetical protein [Armatimonadota bacterium]